YCSYVGEYVVAFLLRILIIYLMGIFCFITLLNYLTAKGAMGSYSSHGLIWKASWEFSLIFNRKERNEFFLLLL
ncbi:hypothetical protein, partial [Flavobacterium bizetiae]|uniref:hypothetical protein n=1 Tax=Flavobacterium bizetiae TaxID=2704140 RepID=UPI001E29CFB6